MIKKLKQKKILVIILVISSLINIVAGMIIFLNIQVVKAPETKFSMDVLEINSDDIKILTNLEIKNPNNFEIITRDLKISTLTHKGDEIASIKIKGKDIPGNGKIYYTKQVKANFKGDIPEALVSKMTGVAGIRIGFLEKTLPISLTVEVKMENLIKNIIPPFMKVEATVGEISQKNVNFSIDVESFNPNSFNISMKDFSIDLLNEEGKNVGNLVYPDIDHKANTTVKFNTTGTIFLKALNANYLIANLSAIIISSIAGFNKSLPITLDSKINLPDLDELLSSNFPTDAVIRSDYRASLFGLVSEITLETHNPNNIEYHVKDIIIEIYRIDKKTRNKVGSGTIDGGILKAKDVTSLSGKVTIPYRRLIIPPWGGRLLPDWMEVTIRANVTIQGLNSYFYVGMVAYQDFHFFKKDVVYQTHKVD